MLLQYEWRGRTFEYHRAQIRDFLDFREATVEDAQVLEEWLRTTILPREHRIEQLKTISYERLRQQRIEPPTPGRLERIVRSALRQYQTDFCQNILDVLSPQTRERLSALLNYEPDQSDEPEQKRSTFYTLKLSPGKVPRQLLCRHRRAWPFL